MIGKSEAVAAGVLIDVDGVVAAHRAASVLLQYGEVEPRVVVEVGRYDAVERIAADVRIRAVRGRRELGKHGEAAGTVSAEDQHVISADEDEVEVAVAIQVLSRDRACQAGHLDLVTGREGAGTRA